MNYGWILAFLLSLTPNFVYAIEIDFYSYILAGPSMYQGDIDTHLESEATLRFGLGQQITKKYGVEAQFEYADPLDLDKVVEYFDIINRDVTFVSSKYWTLFVTHRARIDERFSFLGKLGIRYSIEDEVNSIESSTVTLSPAISAGVVYSRNMERRSQYEFALTHYVGEKVKATGINVTWRLNLK